MRATTDGVNQDIGVGLVDSGTSNTYNVVDNKNEAFLCKLIPSG